MKKQENLEFLIWEVFIINFRMMVQIDDKKKVAGFALDYNNTISKLGTFITAEWTWVKVDVPETYTQQYGNRQHGGFVDIVQPVIKRKVLGWENAVVNLACRFEYVDWNVGYFRKTTAKLEMIMEHYACN